jgi:hypothetical protein
MARAVPRGNNQINMADRMSAGILAHRLLLSSPYAVDKIRIVKTRATVISI